MQTGITIQSYAKNIFSFKILILSIFVLSGCSRYNPDELSIAKYNVLQPPQDFDVLPVPDAKAKYLGYMDANTMFKKVIGNPKIQKDPLIKGADTEILKLLGIQNPPKDIAKTLDLQKGKNLLVFPAKEQKRIRTAERQGVSVIKSQSVYIDTDSFKTPLDKLFE